MTEYSKYNIIYRLQRWLDSVPGQTFLNYAYSWGASIVILATLFKLTHLPGANLMLYIGMGTEVVVFFISAFDRPFDKTAIGKELPTHVTDDVSVRDDIVDAVAPMEGAQMAEGMAVRQGSAVCSGPVGGGTVVLGGIQGGVPQDGQARGTAQVAPSNGQIGGAQGGGQTIVVGGTAAGYAAGVPEISPEMEEATSNYVEELKKLTETLAKVSEQSARLTRDSEEMENLNRTLTGICKVYEMQLKGASSQIGTIDQINEQSRKMAAQIEQLNNIYARMIEAMTVNMRATKTNGNNAEV